MAWRGPWAADGSFDPRGPVADEMARLWWFLLVLGVAVLVVFGVALTVALVRRSDGPEASPSPLRWIVFGGVIMPAVGLAGVFGATMDSMRSIPDRAPPGALTVEIVGHRWWWEISYPDHAVVTANELHIPVGRPVELLLTSADVIHSFWVPQLGGKIDLLPDGVNRMVIEADEAGVYRGQCAEFCGLQHAKMHLVAVAEPAEQFASWLERQRQPAGDPVASVFAAEGCGRCHTVRGTTAAGDRGPDLTHLGSRRTIAAGTLANTRAHLADWITDPQSTKRGTSMPGADLEQPELDALVDYLQGLR